MSLIVKYVGGVKFEVTCRSHRVVIDQPESENGTDHGMTPVELLNASLASCAAYYAAQFLRRRIPELTGLEVQSSWSFSEDPHRVGAVHLTIVSPHDLTTAEQNGLLRVVEHCTIENTLKHTPKIRITVET